MWLINTTSLNLHYFLDADNAPSYAILSHCWADDEMNFEDFRKRTDFTGFTGKGYQKILDCCRFARDAPEIARLLSKESATQPGLKRSVKTRSFNWLWVDTVCIDKTSSAELSEAINSMYHWYQTAGVCLAFLDDMNDDLPPSDTNELFFVDVKWRCFGQKLWLRMVRDAQDPPSLSAEIQAVTGIPEGILDGISRMSDYNIAKRLSWASGRETSRREDTAYCLLGLFGVNMPLIYGEGWTAFRRFQRELLLRYRDESIYAFNSEPSDYGTISFTSDWRKTAACDMLASSPAPFAWSEGVVTRGEEGNSVLATDGNEWRLTVEPSAHHSVFCLSGRKNLLYLTGRENDLLAVRLRCVQTANGCPCILLLEIASCGHLQRVYTGGIPADVDGVNPISYPPAGVMDEERIGNASKWKSFEGPYTNLIHADTASVTACESYPHRSRKGSKFQGSIVHYLGQSDPKTITNENGMDDT